MRIFSRLNIHSLEPKSRLIVFMSGRDLSFSRTFIQFVFFIFMEHPAVNRGVTHTILLISKIYRTAWPCTPTEKACPLGLCKWRLVRNKTNHVKPYVNLIETCDQWNKEDHFAIPGLSRYIVGVFSSDNLVIVRTRPSAYICNIDPSYLFCRHWVVFWFED